MAGVTKSYKVERTAAGQLTHQVDSFSPKHADSVLVAVAKLVLGEHTHVAFGDYLELTRRMDTVPMSLTQYQRLAVATLNQRTDLVYVTGKLQCEAGELSQYALKAAYHGKELSEDDAIEELGDVLWYAAATAEKLGTTLEEVARRNIAKLAARHGQAYNAAHYQEAPAE